MALFVVAMLAFWGSDFIPDPWVPAFIALAVACAIAIAWAWLRAPEPENVTATFSGGVSVNGLPVAPSETIQAIAATGRTDWGGLAPTSLPATLLTIRRENGVETLEFPTIEALHEAMAQIELPEDHRVFLGTDTLVVELGADAMRVFELGLTQGLNARYAFSEIASASAEGDCLELHMLNGNAIQIRLDGFVPLVLERMQRAIDSRIELPSAELLARGDRSALAWTRELRVTADAANYRNASIEIDALWTLVEAPGATPAERASAAVALSLRRSRRNRCRRTIVIVCASSRVQR